MFAIFLLLIIMTLSSCSQYPPDKNLSELKLANSMYIKGENDTALSILEKIENRDPDFAPALYLSGKIYLKKNNKDKAESRFKKIIKKNPYHIQSGKQLLSLFISRKNFIGAEELFFKLYEYSADDPELYILAGKLRKEEERYLEAIEYYKKAFLFEDRIMNAHIDIAEIYENFGITDKSVMHLEKAASIGGENHELYEPIMSVLKKRK